MLNLLSIVMRIYSNADYMIFLKVEKSCTGISIYCYATLYIFLVYYILSEHSIFTFYIFTLIKFYLFRLQKIPFQHRATLVFLFLVLFFLFLLLHEDNTKHYKDLGQ